MPAGEIDLLIEDGATFHREIVWLDEDGDRVDVGLYHGRFEIREYPGQSGTPILTLYPNIRVPGASFETDSDADDLDDSWTTDLDIDEDTTDAASVTPTRDTADATDGTFAQQVAVGALTATGDQAGIVSGDISVREGHEYTLRCDIRATALSNSKVVSVIKFYDASDNLLSTDEADLTAAVGAMAEATHTFTTPEDTDYLTINFAVEATSASGTGTFIVDAVALQSGDGSTLNNFGSGVTSRTGTNTRFDIDISLSDIDALTEWDIAEYDLIVEDKFGTRTKLLKGRAVYEENVTEF